jgi:hypothetical protein
MKGVIFRNSIFVSLI